jgi:hypothetical protein
MIMGVSCIDPTVSQGHSGLIVLILCTAFSTFSQHYRVEGGIDHEVRGAEQNRREGEIDQNGRNNGAGEVRGRQHRGDEFGAHHGFGSATRPEAGDTVQLIIKAIHVLPVNE